MCRYLCRWDHCTASCSAWEKMCRNACNSPHHYEVTLAVYDSKGTTIYLVGRMCLFKFHVLINRSGLSIVLIWSFYFSFFRASLVINIGKTGYVADIVANKQYKKNKIWWFKGMQVLFFRVEAVKSHGRFEELKNSNKNYKNYNYLTILNK